MDSSEKTSIYNTLRKITMSLRKCIQGSLCAFAILSGILLISLILIGLLSAMRDRGFAQGLAGVALLTAVCWAVNFVTLVVLVAKAQLQSLEAEEEEDE